MSTSDKIALFSAICTLGAVVTALFGDRARRGLFPVKLRVLIQPEPPAFERLEGGDHAYVRYWFRLWIENFGESTAERVEIFAAALEKAVLCHGTASPKWERVRAFLPANLRWTHTDHPERPRISAGMGSFFELGKVVHPLEGPNRPKGIQEGNTWFELAVEASASDAHKLAAGLYRLTIRIAADNLLPFEEKLLINLSGQWSDEWGTMFSKNVIVRPDGYSQTLLVCPTCPAGHTLVD